MVGVVTLGRTEQRESLCEKMTFRLSLQQCVARLGNIWRRSSSGGEKREVKGLWGEGDHHAARTKR